MNTTMNIRSQELEDKPVLTIDDWMRYSLQDIQTVEYSLVVTNGSQYLFFKTTKILVFQEMCVIMKMYYSFSLMIVKHYVISSKMFIRLMFQKYFKCFSKCQVL